MNNELNNKEEWKCWHEILKQIWEIAAIAFDGSY